jgi:hypothetical protein
MINPMEGESLQVSDPTLVPCCARAGADVASAVASTVATSLDELIVMFSALPCNQSAPNRFQSGDLSYEQPRRPAGEAGRVQKFLLPFIPARSQTAPSLLALNEKG